MAFVVASLRDLRPAPFFAARAISPVLLAKDTTIVNAVDERFGLAAERKYKAYMAKLERGQTAINDVGRKLGFSNAPSPQRGSSSSRLAECGVEHTRPRACNAS